MADVLALQAQLAQLRVAYASGATRISYDGKSVEYRSLPEMQAAIAALESQIGGTANPVRSILVRSRKGW